MQFQTRIVNGKPTIYFKEGISYIFLKLTIKSFINYNYINKFKIDPANTEKVKKVRN